MARSEDTAVGAWGVSRNEPIHYRCPCGVLFHATVPTVVNATRDPALADKLRAGMLTRVVCPSCGGGSDVALPVVYHDEAAGKVVLVLPGSLRHRELEERAAFLRALADSDETLPPYAVDFAIVYGGAALEAAVAVAGSA